MTVLRLLLITSLLLPLQVVTAATPAPADPILDDPVTTESKVTLNFKDSEIREVIEGIGEITGKNFIVDPRVKGRVTLLSAKPISKEAVYATFLSVLNVHGFAAIPAQGNTVKIVPAAGADQIAGVNTLGKQWDGPGDQIITQVIELDHVPAAQLVAILRPLVPQYGHLAAFQPANILIISDAAANVKRITNIVNRIDQASDNKIEIIPLQHASAADVVQTLQSLAQATAQNSANPITMVADTRTNSILISGDKAKRLRFTAIIAHLDTPMGYGGNTQVIYLDYADAENIATILQGYAEQTVQAGGGAQAGAATAGGEGAGVSIIPDTDLNALVITAPPKAMSNIQAVIGKLDIRRAQVLVEAIIAEITIDRAAELGITWAAASEEDGLLGFTNFAGSGAGVAQLYGASQAGSAALGSLPDGISLGFGRVQDGVFNFAGLLRALAGDGTTNILSTPSLLTVDNEEAVIQVGQEVPFLTGSFTTPVTGGGGGGGAGTINPFQTIQRQEVGIKLKIKPQINAGGSVILEIEQEVSSIASGATGAVDLITNKRTLKTHVIADSGEVIVLGGLIDEQLIESSQSVPLLGSLPLIGNLFRYETAKKVKRNLMIFIQPTILTDGLEARQLTESKYKFIRGIQLRNRKDDILLMPEATRPVLPAYDEIQTPPDAAPDISRDEKPPETKITLPEDTPAQDEPTPIDN
ncbi:MAG TPA: type II secretion system secretin GspD [Gammaproteobacteria bacterium]|nr:type II secretion system secretin GspD [Gammaproteobacteria bacterium]